ncbi:MAG: folylpolyglutamate synthase/dihydrofolate synthase family protein [Bacteroidota bacterium]|nr:folylpolyglutamate synthase/dihydrofolate synthase family protein [Bacteroidota bacterium]MDP3144974.1 folylpolyglutamate synthase/dihydrofolate synthase family protein [Bacteroidota bacterium]MDP3556006.1 folylpolyglutamate synthase/dihydrofolate synthase family protein [Bacteroidota bacterium]
MTYTQTLDYLFARLPMFQRVGAAAYKANLDNTHKIVELLGKPHEKIKCIHVAGTNGKGSSSHMLAAILQQAGYKTGLYTSPHLIDFRERIKINGKMIPKNYITEFVEKYKESFEEIEPSFFEWTVGLAFDYFANEEVDVAIIEVGLGGRLDSTNVIKPEVCLITNISFDHMNLLGDTLEKIAAEKAGIIKSRVPVIISQYQSESGPLFNAVAKDLKSTIEFADKVFKIIDYKIADGFLNTTILNRKANTSLNIDLDLTGLYQLKNLLGVLNTIEFIKNVGFIVEPENIKQGLKHVVKLTGLNGRWQIISENPLMITDTGHNEDGIKNVIANLKTITFNNLHFVFGAVNDKDVSKILELLPKEATYYFTKANIPRALNENELQEQAQKIKLKGKAFETVKSAIEAAKKAYKKSDLILIGGSTFIVGDALAENCSNK